MSQADAHTNTCALTSWHWRWLLFGSVRLIFTRWWGSNGSHVCVWGTAATGVTIDRRRSSPHSNSSAVHSKLLILHSKPHAYSSHPQHATRISTYPLSPRESSFCAPSLLKTSSAAAQLQIRATFIKCFLPTKQPQSDCAGVLKFTLCYYFSFSKNSLCGLVWSWRSDQK